MKVNVTISREQAEELLKLKLPGETLEEKLQAFLDSKLEELTLTEFVPLKIAAAALGISANAARKAVDRGRLEALKVGGALYVSKSSVQEYSYSLNLRHKKYERRELGGKEEKES